MKLIPAAIGIFYRKIDNEVLEIWTQVRTDDGPFHGLLEFPGGGIDPGEKPIDAVVREISEEVGIEVKASDGVYFATYTYPVATKTIILYLFLFPDYEQLSTLGKWLEIRRDGLSSKYLGKIPGPNHQMIDDLFRYLYDEAK